LRVLFSDANIVLISSVQHLVALFSADWLKENKLISEPPIQTFNIPGLSVFNSKTYRLIANDERIQIVTVSDKKEHLETIANVIKKYIESSGSLPFKAIGFNFHFNVEIEEQEQIIQIHHKYIDNISSLFPDHSMNYGAIIYAKNEDYQLRVVIDPIEENIFRYGFNYHINIEGIDHNKLLESLNKILEFYNTAKDFVNKASG